MCDLMAQSFAAIVKQLQEQQTALADTNERVASNTEELQRINALEVRVRADNGMTT